MPYIKNFFGKVLMDRFNLRSGAATLPVVHGWSQGMGCFPLSSAPLHTSASGSMYCHRRPYLMTSCWTKTLEKKIGTFSYHGKRFQGSISTPHAMGTASLHDTT